MKKVIYILISFIFFNFSCNNTTQQSEEKTDDIIEAETILSKEFKHRLSISPYDINLRKAENNWISDKVLEKKDKDGYYNLLKKVIENGFSDELVSGIYKAESNNLKLREFRLIFEENKTMLDSLPKDSSLFNINQLIQELISSRNVTAVDISKSLLNGIQPNDLDKEFYQNIIIIFYSSII
ncbi:hypothetical protein GCM10011344_00650 [Dokdonia pacifica]|uniref:Uncharacterized protein n=1 Tax=Dokdonia pacifica TaxID=1627892 RepID=A0A239D075_9FLAO|nr:hypothetical protein [Dokdonia pacifica]GGG04111.1 hypothetical protein GCM10011344_00650 [Dokdonia pacifica]SNS25760.1 hypothetical protein SAMN06265376_10975 [Dokdonia pacifica]